jgi:hypothetical protein
MDCIKVYDDRLNELIEYVRPCYNYTYWIQLVQYTKSMRRYDVDENYIELKQKYHNKAELVYIDRKPK